MAEKQLNKWSMSLAIWKMQIKTGLIFHLTPVTMARISKTNDSSCQLGCGARGMLIHSLWKCKLVQPLWNQRDDSLKLGIDLPQEPDIPLLGMYPKRSMSYYRFTCCCLSQPSLEKCLLEVDGNQHRNNSTMC